MDIKTFIKHINNSRRGGGWYSFRGTVEGKQVSLKAYKTWLQVFRVDGSDYSGAMDITVKQYNNHIQEALK